MNRSEKADLRGGGEKKRCLGTFHKPIPKKDRQCTWGGGGGTKNGNANRPNYKIEKKEESDVRWNCLHFLGAERHLRFEEEKKKAEAAGGGG